MTPSRLRRILAARAAARIARPRHSFAQSIAKRRAASSTRAADVTRDELPLADVWRSQFREMRAWRAHPRGLVVLGTGVLLAVLVGGLFPVAFAWVQGGLGPTSLGLEAAALASARVTPITQEAPAAAPATPLAVPSGPGGSAAPTPAPTIAPVVAPTSVPTVGATAAISRTPIAVVATAPVPLGTPSANDVWQVLLPELDVAWGVDMPRAIILLGAYLARYPEQDTARSKLYAALVTHARDLVDQGAAQDASTELKRAELLMPQRAEAVAALVALTPTRTPVIDVAEPAAPPLTTRAIPASQPAPVAPPALAPARPAPPPAARPVAPPPPAPTPTKVPFVPPGGG